MKTPKSSWSTVSLPKTLSDKSFRTALEYSLQYQYPLSREELWYWQVGTEIPLAHMGKLPFPQYKKYYYLPPHKRYVTQRLARRTYSEQKWAFFKSHQHLFRRIPTIQAVFVTGALAMDNSPYDDDIDVMIVTRPHTLWITRLCTVLLLKYAGVRRNPSLPEHASPRVSNKLCDNVWMDQNHLYIPHHNLYMAHEILQAKLVWEKAPIHEEFLRVNKWVGKIVPVAYRHVLARSMKHSIVSGIEWGMLLFPVNVLAYVVQYLYMLPKKQSEEIHYHQAFFHPHSSKEKSMVS